MNFYPGLAGVFFSRGKFRVICLGLFFGISARNAWRNVGGRMKQRHGAKRARAHEAEARREAWGASLLQRRHIVGNGICSLPQTFEE